MAVRRQSYVQLDEKPTHDSLHRGLRSPLSVCSNRHAQQTTTWYLCKLRIQAARRHARSRRCSTIACEDIALLIGVSIYCRIQVSNDCERTWKLGQCLAQNNYLPSEHLQCILHVLHSGIGTTGILKGYARKGFGAFWASLVREGERIGLNDMVRFVSLL